MHNVMSKNVKHLPQFIYSGYFLNNFMWGDKFSSNVELHFLSDEHSKCCDFYYSFTSEDHVQLKETKGGRKKEISMFTF